MNSLPEELHVVLVEFDAVEAFASRIEMVNTVQRNVAGSIAYRVGHLKSLDAQSTRGYFWFRFSISVQAVFVQSTSVQSGEKS